MHTPDAGGTICRLVVSEKSLSPSWKLKGEADHVAIGSDAMLTGAQHKEYGATLTGKSLQRMSPAVSS